MPKDLALPVLVGQLIVGGFAGPTLPATFARALAEGRRGGAILFKRNLPTLEASAELCAAIFRAAPSDLPPFIGVDQEGGRVVRLPSPVLRLPPMRELASWGDVGLLGAAAEAVATELRAIGFNLNFAPVLDVNTQAENPVIGDRAFGSDARTVARMGVAYLRGLQQGGVLACGKHFPGHGDTRVDSHLDLPVVEHARTRLDLVDLPPFRAAIGAGIASLMSAHVVYEQLDAGVPATLSRFISGSLLRAELGFDGVLFSDDLEMKAIAARWSMEEAAVSAVWAGCDALLICSDENAQEQAYAGLLRMAERDAHFRDRINDAVTRTHRVRRLCPPRPVAPEALATIVAGPQSRAVAERLARAQNTQAPR